MDIVMPFKSGIEATKEILGLNKTALIIMCSALGQESLVMEAIEAGAADFVVKPFKTEDVHRVVQGRGPSTPAPSGQKASERAHRARRRLGVTKQEYTTPGGFGATHAF
jgi:FixJ family two-component response regulator